MVRTINVPEYFKLYRGFCSEQVHQSEWLNVIQLLVRMTCIGPASSPVPQSADPVGRETLTIQKPTFKYEIQIAKQSAVFK